MIPEVIQFYDSQVARKIQDFENGNPRVEAAFGRLVTLVRNPSVQRVLEVGCGIGSVSYRLAIQRPRCNFVALDPSSESIKVAKDRFRRPNLQYVMGFLESVREGDFDLIFLVDVLEHIPEEDREAFFIGLGSRLSPRGQIFFACPTPQKQLWLRNNAPSEIQPVDNDINLKVANECESITSCILTSWERRSIWHQFDYVHMLFEVDRSMGPKQKEGEVKKGPLWRRIFRRLLKLISNCYTIRRKTKE